MGLLLLQTPGSARPGTRRQPSAVRRWGWSWALAVGIGSAMAQPVAAPAAGALEAELRTLAGQRILFGHQSVGDNLLAGVRALDPAGLLMPGGQAALWPSGATGISHFYAGENTDPLKKIAAFEAALRPGQPPVDVAALKLCYVDIHAQTDIDAVFTAYQQAVEQLRAQRPNLRLVHITVPLTTVQTGWKATVKKWLGRPPYGWLENQRREAYNDRLRRTYGASGRVFDLARVEATRPDGQLHTPIWNGQPVAALYPAYTNDGEHLNPLGQQHAARAWLQTLATVVKAP